MPVRFLDEEPQGSRKVRFLDEPSEGVDVGRFTARSAADIASGAIGAPLDLVKSTISDPLNSALGYAPSPSYTNQIRSGIDNLTGGYTQESKANEDQGDNLRFAASILGFGGAMKGLASKGAQIGSTALETLGNTLGTTTRSGALADAGSVAGYSLADKDNEVGKLIGSVGGSLAGSGIAGFGRALVNPTESLAGTSAKALGIKPENINTKAIQDAQEFGIELPLSLQTKAARAQAAEGALSKIGVGNAYPEKFEKLNQGQIKAFQDSLDEVGSKPPENIGEITQNALQRRIKGLESQTTERYDAATKLIPRGDVASTNNTLKYLDDNIEKLSGSLAPADAERGVVSYLQDLRGALANGADPKRLLQTKISVNRQVDYDAFKGAEKILKGIAPNLNKDIEVYGKTNPDFYEAFTKAENAFKSEVLPTQSKLVRAIIEKDPSQILSSLNSPRYFKVLEQALGTTPNGKSIVQSLKRSKLEEMLERKVITSTGGEGGSLNKFNNGAFISEFDPRSKNAAYYRSLLGKDQFDKLQRLRNLSGAAVDASKNVNFSNTTNKASEIVLATMGTGALLSGNIPGLVAVSSPYFVSKALTNPKVVDAMINVQSSIKNGNANGADKQSKLLIQALKNAGLSQYIGE